MLRKCCFLLSCLLSLILYVAWVPAQEKATPAKKAAAKTEAGKENLVETEHAITVGGTRLAYKATAGTLPLRDEHGKTRANVFFIAYTKAGEKDPSRRPITFCFNGGPGSSSVWLHLGAFGPRRVALKDEGEAPPPPYRLVPNETTLLDQTDLVFIDPVSTGFSRPAEGQDAKQFHGVQQDIHSVGDFIRLYTTRFGRWDSPKFLAGESYGTTRAAGLAGYLQDSEGMNFNGIILVSAVLNFETLSFAEGNDLPYILYLPTYAATAWYHKKLPPDLQSVLHRVIHEVQQFAEGEYAQALFKGNRLAGADCRQVAHKLARYTGLPEEYLLQSNLRVSIQRFTKELLRDQRRTVGRYDSRLTGSDLDAVGERPEYDPSYAAVQGPFTATFNQYVRTELNYKSDLPYEILTSRVQPWDFGRAGMGYLNEASTLRQAMVKNPALRVFVANGYYDLATPFTATEYTFNHLGWNPGLRERVRMGYFEAGHMMYIYKPSREQLKSDLTAFIQAALRS